MASVLRQFYVPHTQQKTLTLTEAAKTFGVKIAPLDYDSDDSLSPGRAISVTGQVEAVDRFWTSLSCQPHRVDRAVAHADSHSVRDAFRFLKRVPARHR